jgi:hypothetical protein
MNNDVMEQVASECDAATQRSVCDPRAHNRSAGSMSIPISGRVSAPYVMRCNLHGNSNNANVEVKQGPLGHYYFIRAPS